MLEGATVGQVKILAPLDGTLAAVTLNSENIGCTFVLVLQNAAISLVIVWLASKLLFEYASKVF